MLWPIGDYSSEELFDEVVPEVVKETIGVGKNQKNRRYDAILIDEGQDFQQSWYDVLCKFLTDNDEFLFVIDERQNVYSRNLSWIENMQGTKFKGRWRELKNSYRLSAPLIEKTNEFSKQFFPDVGIDSLPDVYQPSFFDPHLIWINLDNNKDGKERILSVIKWLTEKQTTHPQDIVILVPSHAEGWGLVELLEANNFQVNHVSLVSAK